MTFTGTFIVVGRIGTYFKSFEEVNWRRGRQQFQVILLKIWSSREELGNACSAVANDGDDEVRSDFLDYLINLQNERAILSMFIAHKS